MPAQLTRDDPVYQAIRGVEMAEEIERLTVELVEERKEKERAQGDAATLRGKWLGMKNERDAALRSHTIPAPSHYNDIHISPFLSHGVMRYQIVATDYHGDEVRINVDPDTLVRFACEALAAAVADGDDENGYWTRPWAEQ